MRIVTQRTNHKSAREKSQLADDVMETVVISLLN